MAAIPQGASLQREHEGTGLVGRKPEKPPSPRDLLRRDAVNNFVFLAHPTAWDVALLGEDAFLVPRLRRFHFEPGVACVEQVKGQHDGNPEKALLLQRQKGWREIPRDREVVAFDEVFDDYAHRIDGYRGPVHFSIWERPYVIGANVEVDFDDTGWKRFLVGLVEEGVVPRPGRAIEQAIRIQFVTAMRRYQTSGLKSASAIAHAEVYEQKLAAFTVVSGGKARPADAEIRTLRTNAAIDDAELTILRKNAVEAEARLRELEALKVELTTLKAAPVSAEKARPPTSKPASAGKNQTPAGDAGGQQEPS